MGNQEVFQNKRIVLGVTGGIAAFKAASLCFQLKQLGADVHVVMTENALKFITALTFEALSGNPVMINTFTEENPAYISHIHYSDTADLIILAPLTANTLNKIAAGIADNMLTNIIIKTKDFTKILLCPAMNTDMFQNPITQENIYKLKRLGMAMLDPAFGMLACGVNDEGKLPDTATLVQACEQALTNREEIK
jgi:phosphopantothenoylcysteine decarboxylase/phosphopantothenate--cysteine ligase